MDSEAPVWVLRERATDRCPTWVWPRSDEVELVCKSLAGTYQHVSTSQTLILEAERRTPASDVRTPFSSDLRVRV